MGMGEAVALRSLRDSLVVAPLGGAPSAAHADSLEVLALKGRMHQMEAELRTARTTSRQARDAATTAQDCDRRATLALATDHQRVFRAARDSQTKMQQTINDRNSKLQQSRRESKIAEGRAEAAEEKCVEVLAVQDAAFKKQADATKEAARSRFLLKKAEAQIAVLVEGKRAADAAGSAAAIFLNAADLDRAAWPGREADVRREYEAQLDEARVCAAGLRQQAANLVAKRAAAAEDRDGAQRRLAEARVDGAEARLEVKALKQRLAQVQVEADRIAVLLRDARADVVSLRAAAAANDAAANDERRHAAEARLAAAGVEARAAALAEELGAAERGRGAALVRARQAGDRANRLDVHYAEEYRGARSDAERRAAAVCERLVRERQDALAAADRHRRAAALAEGAVRALTERAVYLQHALRSAKLDGAASDERCGLARTALVASERRLLLQGDAYAEDSDAPLALRILEAEHARDILADVAVSVKKLRTQLPVRVAVLRRPEPSCFLTQGEPDEADAQPRGFTERETLFVLAAPGDAHGADVLRRLGVAGLGNDVAAARDCADAGRVVADRMARVATAVRRYEAAAAETCGRLRAALVVCASALTDAAAVETAEEPPGLAVETAAKVALTLRLTDALAKAATADRPLCLDLSALGLNDAVCVGVAQRLGKGADKMCAQDAWAAAGGSLALKNKHLNVGAPPVVRKFDERRPCAFHGGPALRPPADFVARLVLRGNDLGDVAARALAAIIEKMPRLLLLDLRDNPSITAAGRGALEAAVRRNASVVNVSVADGAALSGEGGIVAGWREQSAASAAGDALQALPFVDDADGKFAAVPPDKRPLVVDLRRSRDLEPADGGTRRFRPLAAAMLALRPATAAALAAAAQGQDTAALAAAARGQDKAQEAWLAHLTAPAARAAPRAVRRASRPSVDEAATRADKFRRSIEASSRQSSRQPAHRRSAPSFEIRTTARTLSLSASDPGFRVKLHSKNYAKKKLRARQPAMATLADDEGPLEIRDAEPPSRHRSAIHVIQ